MRVLGHADGNEGIVRNVIWVFVFSIKFLLNCEYADTAMLNLELEIHIYKLSPTADEGSEKKHKMRLLKIVYYLIYGEIRALWWSVVKPQEDTLVH